MKNISIKYGDKIMVVKIAIIKSGNIGTSPVIDLLLDERADRPNSNLISQSSLAQTQEHLDQLEQENSYLKKTFLLLSSVTHLVKVKKMKWTNKVSDTSSLCLTQ